MAYKHEVAGNLRSAGRCSQYGSMASKFSPNGTFLAFHCTAYMRSNHEIIIIQVNNLQIIHTLAGHLNIVYDLDWLSDNVIASVSSDRTAIIWFLTENSFKMKVSHEQIEDSNREICFLYPNGRNESIEIC